MIRRIIEIDKEKCNGCGACADACHEGAIGMVDGKAELLRDDYCDGLGDCLPACPTGAISFVEREAAEYDEAAVMENKKKKGDKNTRSHDHTHAHGGCPGSRMRQMSPRPVEEKTSKESVSQLAQWPCQIKLVPVNAPYFQNAKLLVAADCTAFAQSMVSGGCDMIIAIATPAAKSAFTAGCRHKDTRALLRRLGSRDRGTRQGVGRTRRKLHRDLGRA